MSDRDAIIDYLVSESVIQDNDCVLSAEIVKRIIELLREDRDTEDDLK